MNTINNNDYLYRKAICDYQNVKVCIGQGLRIPERGNTQNNKEVKEDFISEKLITNLNAGIGRMKMSESVPPTFGWGSGFFNQKVQ